MSNVVEMNRFKARLAEQYMIEHGEPVDIPVYHHFSNKGTRRGVYAREIIIPKGTLLSGHIHKYEQLNFLMEGDITVLTENGPVRLSGPTVVWSPSGTKRIAYTHERTRWITIHATEHSEVSMIEEECIAKTEEEFTAYVEAQKLLEDKP